MHAHVSVTVHGGKWRDRDKRQEWRGVVREMSRERGVAREKRQNLYITNCFQAARRERWTKMPVELTLRRIMKGEVTICLLLLV